jgi:hypothetical protein
MNSDTEDLSIILAAAAQERVTHGPSTHIYVRFISHKIASLKGLSHEIDFKNFDKNLQNWA